MKARFAHTNLIAADWEKLASFYERVFGCTRVLPTRDLSGPSLAAGTNIADAALRGVHLRLPGWGADGPTLEIFQYAELAPTTARAVNRPGYGHIAFEVDDVEAAQRETLEQGGAPVGEVVTLTVSPTARVTWCYVTDPEGNAIELQSWQRD